MVKGKSEGSPPLAHDELRPLLFHLGDPFETVQESELAEQAKLRGSSDSPMWKRGNRVRSSTRTRSPARAMTRAAVDPAGPPPMMTAS